MAKELFAPAVAHFSGGVLGQGGHDPLAVVTLLGLHRRDRQRRTEAEWLEGFRRHVAWLAARTG